MKGKVFIRPSKASGIVLLVMAPLFLVFGVVLCGAAEGEARPYAMIFLAIWVTVCGSMIVYALSILFFRHPPSVTEIDVEDPDGDRFETKVDFEQKLRKVEALRRDRLITEGEYMAKRSEVMKEKW